MPRQTERYTHTEQDYVAELRELRGNLKTRMKTCTSPQSYAMLGNLLLDVVTKLHALTGEVADDGPRDEGLDVFMRKMREKAQRAV